MTLLDINLIFTPLFTSITHPLSPEYSGGESILTSMLRYTVYQPYLFKAHVFLIYILAGTLLYNGVFVIIALIKMIFFYRTRMSKDVNLCENRSYRLFLLAFTPLTLKMSTLVMIQNLRCVTVSS